MMYNERPHAQYEGDILHDNVTSISKALNAEFTAYQQSVLRKEHAKCETAPYPDLCLKNAIVLNTVLNKSTALRLHFNNHSYQ